MIWLNHFRRSFLLGTNPVGSFLHLVFTSVFYYRLNHLALIIGTAIAAVTLTGALVIGDSLRNSLQTLARSRLGYTQWVVTSSSGNFRSPLADSLAVLLNTTTVPLLIHSGSVSIVGGNSQANKVMIHGVDHRFWRLGLDSSYNPMSLLNDNEVLVNQTLAKKLSIAVGDEIIIRFEQNDFNALEAPFFGGKHQTGTLRMRVHRIIDREQFGDFSLKSEHYSVDNLFVPLSFLQQVKEKSQQISFILIKPTVGMQTSFIEKTLRKIWQPEDGGIQMRMLKSSDQLEIYSDNIFLSDSLLSSIRMQIPTANPIFTYFVNSLIVGDRQTPYSFVSTAPPEHHLSSQDILLNTWLAKDLKARIGDSLRLTYYIPQGYAGVQEQSQTFIIKGIVPSEKPWTDSTLMPSFPGFSKVENCSDWDPGVSIDLKRIRSQDEHYWDTWRGTPKAFISFTTAQKLWKNRFGVCTAIRIPLNDSISENYIRQMLRQILSPSLLGLQLLDVHASITKSRDQGVDFTPLFFGLSFFILIATLILIYLLFGFMITSRLQNYQIFASSGFKKSYIIRLFLGEGLVVAGCGIIIGCLCSPIYTKILLFALTTIWHAAAQTPELKLHLSFFSLLLGGTLTFVSIFLVMWVSVRPAIKPLFRIFPKQSFRFTRKKAKTILNFFIFFLCISFSLLLLNSIPNPQAKETAGIYFIAGILLVGGMLILINIILLLSLQAKQGHSFSLFRLVITNLARHRSRTIATAAILACGLFILGTVNSFRLTSNTNPRDRKSGTGGFWWYGELRQGILPSSYSHNYLSTFNNQNISHDLFSLGIRVKDGDDASCFNLHRISQPTLFGINEKILDSLECFTFAQNDSALHSDRPWSILNHSFGPNAIPGIADQSVITWGLGKALGDTLHYINEKGDSLRIILVGGLENSIFQGKVLIGEKHFIHHFPSIGGYRSLLVNPPRGEEKLVAEALRNGLFDKGLELEATIDRLHAFAEVTNTYLSIFSFLGIIALLLGCLGFIIVFLRNTLERKNELAVLQAQGFKRTTMQRLLITEHILILLAGSLSGIIPAVIASQAALSQKSVVIGILSLVITVVIAGLGSILVTARIAGVPYFVDSFHRAD